MVVVVAVVVVVVVFVVVAVLIAVLMIPGPRSPSRSVCHSNSATTHLMQ